MFLRSARIEKIGDKIIFIILWIIFFPVQTLKADYVYTVSNKKYRVIDLVRGKYRSGLIYERK